MWANPHIDYYVDVPDENDRVTRYAVEGGTPTDPQHQDVRRDSFKPGETVTVSGLRARDGSSDITGRDVTSADVRNVFAGSDDGAPGPND